jgi:hypothetical protein
MMMTMAANDYDDDGAAGSVNSPLCPHRCRLSASRVVHDWADLYSYPQTFLPALPHEDSSNRLRARDRPLPSDAELDKSSRDTPLQLSTTTIKGFEE